MINKPHVQGSIPFSSVSLPLLPVRRAAWEDVAVCILSVSGEWDHHAELGRCLAAIGYQTVPATSCEEALQVLHDVRIAAIVCDTNLTDGTWQDILNLTPASSLNPALVVSSPCPDEYLWAEVLNLGGFDVIARPFDRRDVHHIVEAAVQHYAGHVARR